MPRLRLAAVEFTQCPCGRVYEGEKCPCGQADFSPAITKRLTRDWLIVVGTAQDTYEVVHRYRCRQCKNIFAIDDQALVCPLCRQQNTLPQRATKVWVRRVFAPSPRKSFSSTRKLDAQKIDESDGLEQSG